MAPSAAEFVKSGQSKINDGKYSGVLNRDEMFNKGWWLQYCICDGRIIGNVGEPFFGSEGKTLCEHETCECVPFGDPFCSKVETSLCVTEQCAFPKIDGSPTCVCFNKILAGGDTSGWKPKLFDTEYAWGNQFWIYYFLCMGCSVHGPGANERPLFAHVDKTFCIKDACQCVPFVEEGTMCASVGTALCYWDQCQCPPAANNPKFACCGFKLNKGNGNGSPMSYGKPGQEEMS